MSKLAIALFSVTTVFAAERPVLEIYSDFQCPFCARLAAPVEKLRAAVGDLVEIRFRDFPLDFHRDAPLAHLAARAARAQGKFWEMHDLIFGGRLGLKREALFEYARELGLDMARFEADLKSEALFAAVEADKKAGTAVGVGGTPTLFLNGKPFVSGRTYRELRRTIEAQSGVRLGTMLTEDRLLRGGPGKAKVLEAFVRFTGADAASTLSAADVAYRQCSPDCSLRLRYFPAGPGSDVPFLGWLAASAQGRGWEMATALAKILEPPSLDGLIPIAAGLSLDLERFWRYLETDQYDGHLAEDTAAARRMNLMAPALVVGSDVRPLVEKVVVAGGR